MMMVATMLKVMMEWKTLIKDQPWHTIAEKPSGL